jgi:hypothetical protein
MIFKFDDERENYNVGWVLTVRSSSCYAEYNIDVGVVVFLAYPTL